MIKLKFNRIKRTLYFLVMPYIYIDGEFIKSLNNGEVYEHYVEKGEHEITVVVQWAVIVKKINIRENMEFNIYVHMDSFDLKIKKENTENSVGIDDRIDKQKIQNSEANVEKISAKNDFSLLFNSKNKKEHKPISGLRFMSRMALFFGLLIIFLGILWGSTTSAFSYLVSNNFVEITSDIISVKEYRNKPRAAIKFDYTLVIKYEVNGQTYQSKIFENR